MSQVPDQITEFIDAATALIATIEQTEVYKDKIVPPHIEQHNRAAVERVAAALSRVSRLYPTFKAYKVRRHLIHPVVKDGKIESINVIPSNAILDVNSMLENE